MGNQPSLIAQPRADAHLDVAWSSAIVGIEKNPRLVSFQRPTNEKSEHFMSTNQQIQRLEAELARRNDEIALLRQQLFKSHRENYRLVERVNM